MSPSGSKIFITKEVINMKNQDKDIITMSTKELDRAEVLSKLQQKAITQSQAADNLGLSVRHIKRLF